MTNVLVSNATAGELVIYGNSELKRHVRESSDDWEEAESKFPYGQFLVQVLSDAESWPVCDIW